MKAAGYATWFGGKYMNGSEHYPDSYRPPGWDSFTHYTYPRKANANGNLVGFHPQNYTDWLSERADMFLANRDGGPFFMQVCTKDPHPPMNYPDRHAKKFANAQVPTPPSFDESDLSDKPAWVRDNAPWTQEDTREATLEYRERLRAMATTEDLVIRLLGRLEAERMLDNTYVFFTSDNGFHKGLHGLRIAKWTPYTEAHRVPFVVRGPGIAPATTPALASNIDVAPTILDLAGVSRPEWMDGRSLAPVLFGRTEKVRDVLLLEGSPDRQVVGGYRAAKTEADTYVEYDTGEREFYLATEDPYQLDSRHDDASYADVVAERAGQVGALKNCSGDSCRVADIKPPVP